jgi:hypothetical protein
LLNSKLQLLYQPGFFDELLLVSGSPFCRDGGQEGQETRTLGALPVPTSTFL